MSDRTVQAKSELRRAMRQALSGLSQAERDEASQRICSHLRTAPALARPGAIMLFAPTPTEPNIDALAQELISKGSPVCVPSIDWQGGTMSAAQLTNWASDLVIGRHSVREPRPGLGVVEPEHLSVVIVPGLAFDRAGRRLGRGGGFYDRFLARLSPSTHTIGLCFDRQVVEHIPADSNDRPVQWLAHESSLVSCGTPQHKN